MTREKQSQPRVPIDRDGTMNAEDGGKVTRSGKRVITVVGVAALATLMGGAGYALPTAEEVLKGMAEKEATVKAMEYDYTQRTDVLGDVVVARGHTVAAKVEEDGKVMQKFLRTEGCTLHAGGKSMTCERKEVCDGKFLWHEMRYDKQPVRRVSKMKARGLALGLAPVMSKLMVEGLKKDAALGKVSEETIDGKKMFVFEVIIDPGQPEPVAAVAAKMRLYVSEGEMTLRRVATYGAKGQETDCLDFADVELGGKVDAELFVYKVPAGAVVDDMTEEKGEGGK